MAELQNSFVQPSPKARRLLRQLWELSLGHARLPHHLSSHTVGFCNKQMSCLSHGDSEPRLHVLMRFCLDPCPQKLTADPEGQVLHLGVPMVHPDKDRYQKTECELPDRCEVQGCF